MPSAYEPPWTSQRLTERLNFEIHHSDSSRAIDRKKERTIRRIKCKAQSGPDRSVGGVCSVKKSQTGRQASAKRPRKIESRLEEKTRCCCSLWIKLADTMSATTVFRFGGSIQSELGCGSVAKVVSMRRHRVRISGERITLWGISAAAAARYDIAGTGIHSEQAWDAAERPEEGKEAGEISPATEYLDSELSESLHSGGESVRQIVLLTDGTDTRLYRMKWPSPSVIFAVSPRHTHDDMMKKMAVSGLKIPKSCLVQHVSEDFAADENEDEDWGEKLLRVGYRGEKPSVWLLEMRNEVSDGYLKQILPVASSLLMKNSLFIGAVPAFTSCEVETRERVRKLLASHGFLAEFRAHWKLDPQGILEMERSRELAVDMTHDPPLFLTFSARQLRLSDPQVQYARMQIMTAEEEGDEEGFMDAW